MLVSRENQHYTSDHEVVPGSVYGSALDASLYLQVGVALRQRNF